MTAFPRTRNAALVGAVCTALALALAGCAEEDPDAGTNGVGRLAPQKIETKALKAVEGATSVRLSGSVVSQGRTYRIDMRLKQGERGGGVGEVATKDSTFELLRVGDALYLKADADFWAHQHSGEARKSDNSAADKLEHKYVKVPSGDSAYQQLSGFTDMELLLEGLLGLHGRLTAGDRDSVGGVRTVRVEAGNKGEGGALDVSLEGTPYPLRLQRAGGAGELELVDWNEDFTLKPPSKDDIVDYGKQISAAGG
ncbi:hypothetical protein AB0C51_08055 [Streptomyces pathocidini]|uniref:Lipoprotein n=1 Tax=Streptomyces pathocidini TaxID=1650571 RepID=A0ABW7UT73_9ACTN|nr:hypothetical protein [Streptomyces pathocidini]